MIDRGENSNNNNSESESGSGSRSESEFESENENENEIEIENIFDIDGYGSESASEWGAKRKDKVENLERKSKDMFDSFDFFSF